MELVAFDDLDLELLAGGEDGRAGHPMVAAGAAIEHRNGSSSGGAHRAGHHRGAPASAGGAQASGYAASQPHGAAEVEAEVEDPFAGMAALMDSSAVLDTALSHHHHRQSRHGHLHHHTKHDQQHILRHSTEAQSHAHDSSRSSHAASAGATEEAVEAVHKAIAATEARMMDISGGLRGLGASSGPLGSMADEVWDLEPDLSAAFGGGSSAVGSSSSSSWAASRAVMSAGVTEQQSRPPLGIDLTAGVSASASARPGSGIAAVPAQAQAQQQPPLLARSAVAGDEDDALFGFEFSAVPPPHVVPQLPPQVGIFEWEMGWQGFKVVIP